MSNKRQAKTNRIITYTILAIGVALVVISAFYTSSFLAIVGVSIVFWGAVLLYITPTKHVPLTLLNATADTNTNNIERILAEFTLTEKGIYLPPKSLKNIESSLIYVPETPKAALPTPEETTEKLYSEHKKGVFLTPPGLALSRLFEQKLGISFTKIDLPHLQKVLSKLLVQDLEIATTAEIKVQNNTITVELTGNILNQLCQQTDDLPQTHRQVGCILTSALACAFAKASGKPITIQSETHDLSAKNMLIQYQIEEE
jgi:hypothetical protein